MHFVLDCILFELWEFTGVKESANQISQKKEKQKKEMKSEKRMQ